MKIFSKHSKKFIFWQQWLFYSSLIFAMFGVILAFFGNTPLFRNYFRMLAEIFWNAPSFPEEAAGFRNFVLGPLGGTIACCYLLLAFLAKYPFKKKERWARNAIVAAFTVWFIIDSSVCIYYGVFFQALIVNVFSLLIKMMPVIFTWNDFNPELS